MVEHVNPLIRYANRRKHFNRIATYVYNRALAGFYHVPVEMQRAAAAGLLRALTVAIIRRNETVEDALHDAELVSKRIEHLVGVTYSAERKRMGATNDTASNANDARSETTQGGD